MEKIELIKDRVVLETNTIEEIIDRIINETNNFVIPEYQRDYVWKEKNVPSLLLSLYKGYPIGTMLLQTTNTGKLKLLDGLQRSFSIVKISKKPMHFISEGMIDHYFENHYDSSELTEREVSSLKERVWEKIREAIKEFEGKDDILESKRIYGLLSDGETKEALKEFLSHFEEWIDFDFKSISVPQIKLTSNLDDKESTEVFELINSQGKSLNNYEILSSYWSNYKIETDGIAFIENFINTRVKRFLKAIESNDSSKVDMDKKNISPANFIYAVFDEAIKSNPTLKFAYYKGDVLRTKSLDSITTIFANILGLESIDNKSLKTIGPLLKEKINDENDVNDMLNLISRSLRKLTESIKIFAFISSNGHSENVFNSMSISIALITSLLNHIIKMELAKEDSFDPLVHGKHFTSWLLIDTIEGEYKTGSSRQAWSNLSNGKYYEEPGKNIIDLVTEYVDKEAEDKTVKTSIAPATILILAIIQHRFKKDESTSYDVDHIIPKFLFNTRNTRKNYINTIANLQLLSSDINRNLKRDLIVPERDQWDFLMNNELINIDAIDKDFTKNHKFYLETMKTNYYKLDGDKIETSKHTVAKSTIVKAKKKTKIDTEIFYEFYEMRLVVLRELIKKAFKEI